MFLYFQDDKSFHKCLNETSGTFTEFFMITMQGLTWIEKQPIPQEYFILTTLLSKTGHLFLKSLAWEFLFLILIHFEKKHIPLKPVSFPNLPLTASKKTLWFTNLHPEWVLLGITSGVIMGSVVIIGVN